MENKAMENAHEAERVLGSTPTGGKKQGALCVDKDSVLDPKGGIHLVATATGSDDASSSSSRASLAARVLAVGEGEEGKLRIEGKKKLILNSTDRPSLVALEPGGTVSTGDLRRSSSSSVDVKLQVVTPTSLPSPMVLEPERTVSTGDLRRSSSSSIEKKRLVAPPTSVPPTSLPSLAALEPERTVSAGDLRRSSSSSVGKKRLVAPPASLPPTSLPAVEALEPERTVSTGNLRRSSSSSVEDLQRQVAIPTNLPSLAEPSSLPGTPGSSSEKERILGTQEIQKGGQIISPRLPAVTESSTTPTKLGSPTKKQMLSTKQVREGAGIGTLPSLPSVSEGPAAPGKPESTKKEVMAPPHEPQASGPRLPSLGESTATPGKSEGSTKKEVLVDESGPRLPSVGEASAQPGKPKSSTEKEVVVTARGAQGNRPRLPSVGESSAVPGKPETSTQKEVLSTTQETYVDSQDGPRLPSVTESSIGPGRSEPSKDKDEELKDLAARASRFPRFIEKTKSDASVGVDGQLKKQKSQHSVAKSEDDRIGNKKEKDEELAVATLVDDMPKVVTSAEAYDDLEAREKSPFYRRPAFWIVAVLAVLSVTAGVVIMMLGGADDELDFVTGTLAPTVSPTFAPTDAGPFLLRLELEETAGSQLVGSSPVAFSSAVEWYYADRNTNVAETVNLQRFALTWFWYHTTNDGLDPWISCNPPNAARGETEQCSFLDVANVDIPELCYETAANGIRWLSATGECDWSGIKCDDSGIVTSIDLKGAGLKGTFPAFISLLRGLTRLALTYGALSGALPEEINRLTNLQDLTLIGNQLEAPIPDSLFSLPLVKLNLSYNKYEGTLPASIGNLSSIGGLFLSDNKFSGPLPAELSLATNLENLQLQRNAFTGSSIPTSWGDLVQLQQLHMDNNGFVGTIPQEFSKLVSMSEFWLHQNNLEGPLPDMPWPVIKDVLLQGNSFNGTFPASLYGKSRLRLVDISSNELSSPLEDNFDGMFALLVLVLNNNRFTGPLPVSLSQLESLRVARLHYNQFEGDVPEEICDLRTSELGFLVADCAGNGNPCSCCTSCCDRDALTCQVVEDRRLETEAYVEERKWERGEYFEQHATFHGDRERVLQVALDCAALYRWDRDSGALELIDER